MVQFKNICHRTFFTTLTYILDGIEPHFYDIRINFFFLQVAIIAFLLHVSGLFVSLQPNLNHVLWIAAAVVGFLSHYVLPQLRKQERRRTFRKD
jgi:cytosine/uracil/thiamine/allantoin permease